MSLIYPLKENNFLRLCCKAKTLFHARAKKQSETKCFTNLKNKRMSEDNPDLCKEKENKVVIFTTAKIEFRTKVLNETKKKMEKKKKEAS